MKWSGNSAASLNILIVDDTRENLLLLAGILEEHGYEVRPVTSGRQALQAAANAPPDLVLLDISMPEMDGYQVCTHLKADANTRDVPVIFLTAMTDAQHKVRAFEAGGVDYITKPFQVEEVLARVSTHLLLRRNQCELAQSLERLRSVERMRDDLAHMIVHDMRSPLMIITATLQQLRSQSMAGAADGTAQDLQMALKAAATASSLANDLLDVSRLEQGNLPLRLASCDLAAMTQEVAASFVDVDPARKIQVTSGGSAEAVCDGSIVRRVIENLISNGIKHTPRGSPLEVCIARAEQRMRLSVQDRGPGVPAEAKHRIFEKFGAVELRNVGMYHSAGLGLAFCRLAIEAHGGRVGVDDGEVGGSKFWFELAL